MAVDGKYGRVTIEHGTIGEEEPVIVFRAQDVVLPDVLAYYIMECVKKHSPYGHILTLMDALNRIVDWQQKNTPKVPD